MEHFNEFEQDQDYIADRDVLKMVLFEPKKAFRFIHKFKYENHLRLLLVVGGITSSFNQAASNNHGDTGSLGSIIFVSVIIGGLLGWISYYIFAHLISWTGNWIDGKANSQEVLRVLAYGSLPSSLSLIIIFIGMLVFQINYFQSSLSIDPENYILQAIYYLLTTISAGLSLYSIALYVMGVAQVQGFSYAKAILNLILPILLFVAFGLVLYLLITVLD